MYTFVTLNCIYITPTATFVSLLCVLLFLYCTYVFVHTIYHTFVYVNIIFIFFCTTFRKKYVILLMEVLRMTTGEKIRYFRTSHGFTQEQLASESGLSISALQKYESDERKPKPEQLLKISDALGISINIFMDFDIRTISDLFSLLFRMEEQADLKFYEDTKSDVFGIYFENEQINQKLASYAEMLKELEDITPSHQELMHTKIQNELLNDNTSIQETSLASSSTHENTAASMLATEEKLLDIVSDCTPAEQEHILNALTFLKDWMRKSKEK